MTVLRGEWYNSITIYREQNTYKEEVRMKIEKEELIEQVTDALKDVFVAEVTKSENGFALRFLNGQSFEFVVNEQ